MNQPFRARAERLALVLFACLVVGVRGADQPAATAAVRAGRQPDPVAFAVSALDPAAHLFHVVVRCDTAGQRSEFRMPVWTPGYYGLFDFAGNVRNFTAVGSAGALLPWEKTGANAWAVQNGGAVSIELRYDVLAARSFVANAYLDPTHGYVLPGALFMYMPGRLNVPVTVTVETPSGWADVATGLDQASSGPPHTFTAPDFDVLYDVGSQEPALAPLRRY